MLTTQTKTLTAQTKTLTAPPNQGGLSCLFLEERGNHLAVAGEDLC